MADPTQQQQADVRNNGQRPEKSLAACTDAAALAEAIAQRCADAKPDRDGWKACCPAHDDRTPSLSITPKDNKVLLKCYAGCDTKAVLAGLGLSWADLFVDDEHLRLAQDSIVKVYDYYDADGLLVHQTVRFSPKRFSQRRPHPTKPGVFEWNLKGISPVLYHLPEILEAIAMGHPIYLPEGEKDADTLAAQGLTATTNPMGAKYWRESYTQTLKDAHVVMLADFDQAGLEHVYAVAKKLIGTVASLKVITGLHTTEPKSDITDWFQGGGTRAEFDAFVESAAFYTLESKADTAESKLSVLIETTPKVPALPEDVACRPPHLKTWLSAYVDHSKKWAPRAAPGYHAAVGLWVLSTIAARRIVAHMGSNDIFPTLFIALVSESTLWTKTTAASLGIRLIRRAGCGHLLSPDRTTPQFLLKLMGGVVPEGYASAPIEEQYEMRKAFGFAAQRGWFYEEWGGMLHQMRRIDSPHAELNKLLIVLEGGEEKPFETGSIKHGLNRIEKPYLALLGNATPHDLIPFMGEGDAWWHDGFWPRFVFVTPPRGAEPTLAPMPRDPFDTPAALINDLDNWHRRLGSPDVAIDEVQEASGKRTGLWKGRVSGFPEHTLTLEKTTYDAYDAYGNALWGMIKQSKASLSKGEFPLVHEDLWAWYGRAHQKALRVAMLLTSIDGHAVITLPYWQEAQTIVEEWRHCLHEIAASLGAEGQSTRQAQRRLRLEKRIEYLLSVSSGLTSRELQKHLRGVPGDELHSILESMLKIGTITTAKNGKRILYLIFNEELDNE